MKLWPKYSLKLTRNQTETHTFTIRNKSSSHGRRHHKSDTTQRPKRRDGTGNDVGRHRSSVERRKTASDDRKRRPTTKTPSEDRNRRPTTKSSVRRQESASKQTENSHVDSTYDERLNTSTSRQRMTPERAKMPEPRHDIRGLILALGGGGVEKLEFRES